jgi:peptidoglycan/LPS O-acetylase OafA/YrhL
MGLIPSGPISYQDYLRRTYLPELDGLRAFSVLMVIASHMADTVVWAWLGGKQGVTIFFVLSGYLITLLALREERENGVVSLQAFYIRRSCRIFPLYYLALAILCILTVFGWGLAVRQNFIEALPAYLFYYQEVQFAQEVVAGKSNLFAHSWSLGIEEKFYLVWPFLAFAVWRLQPRSRLRGAVMLATAFASMKTLVHCDDTLASWQVDRILFPYFQILVGCILALLLDDPLWNRRLAWLTRPRYALLIVAAFVGLHLLSPQTPPAYHEIQIPYTIAVALLLAVVVLGRGPLQAILRIQPLVFIGQLSYGMYLFHGIGISVAQKIIHPASGRVSVAVLSYALACLATIAIAWVLSLVVEKPLIRFGKRWSQRVIARRAKQEQTGPTAVVPAFTTSQPVS